MTTDTRHPRVCMRIKKVAHLSPFDAFLFRVEFFRLKELVQMKNFLTTSLPFYLFFFDNAKHLGRSDDAKRRKIEDGLSALEMARLS